eukprot:SAG31_NODE_2676_length_5264_cov_576.907278_7_plen_297_part_00
MEEEVLSQGLISSATHFQNWVEEKLRKHGVLLEFAPFEGDDSDSSGTTQKQGRGETDAKLQTGNGFVCNYIDDLVIVSNSVEEHKQHLLKLFDILSEENIYLNPSKSVLFAKYVRYLGCVCGQDQLITDPEKVRAILKMPEPRKDQTAIRGFLGMCSFWRRWIPGYATVAAPLHELLKKDVDVPTAWTERHSKATSELKQRLVSHPVLRQPDPAKQFEIIGDACDYAIGSALVQRYDEVPCVVAYCSRSLHAAELNYSVQEKECLAIIYSLQKFRHYVLCSRIKLRIFTKTLGRSS